jgi:hypothetical protein
MILVCTTVIVVALLAFTWAVDRASEIFEEKAAHPGSSGPTATFDRPTGSLGQLPGGRRPGGFVSDVHSATELPGPPGQLLDN